MAEKFVKRVAPDRGKINMDEDHEVKYWIKHLDVTRDELRQTVEKVGNSATAVLKEPGKRRPPVCPGGTAGHTHVKPEKL